MDRVRTSMHQPSLGESTGERVGNPSKLLVHGCPALFSISQEEILDKSKADIASKTITLFQTSWFALQIISRAAQHLAISTLEIFTLSIVACCLVSILLWWHKPKDVSTLCVIQIHLTNEELEQVLAGPRPSWNGDGVRTSVYLFAVIASFSAAFFSASIPLLAWHFSFATHAEHIIWNVFSVVLLLSCLLTIGFIVLVGAGYDADGVAISIFVLVLTIVYVLLCSSATLLCCRSFHRPTLVSSRSVRERGLVFVSTTLLVKPFADGQTWE
jgi:hypothetical protein